MEADISVFGISADRAAASSLTDFATSQDTLSAAMGFALAKERLTLGVGYSRVTSANPPNNGTVTGSLTWNPMADKGFGIGLGVSDGLSSAGGTASQAATVSAGYFSTRTTRSKFLSGIMTVVLTNDKTAGVAVTMGGQFVYLGLLGQYNTRAADYEAAVRLGFVLGNSFDLSLFGDKTFVTGAALTYGASARIVL